MATRRTSVTAGRVRSKTIQGHVGNLLNCIYCTKRCDKEHCFLMLQLNCCEKKGKHEGILCLKRPKNIEINSPFPLLDPWLFSLAFAAAMTNMESVLRMPGDLWCVTRPRSDTNCERPLNIVGKCLVLLQTMLVLPLYRWHVPKVTTATYKLFHPKELFQNTSWFFSM